MNKRVWAALAATVLATGCANMDQTQRGTAMGAGVGAGIGAVLGAATGPGGGGRAATGAVLGGAVGAVAGNVWSRRMEEQKQQMQQATQGTGVQVTQTADNQLKMEIPSDISFDVGRSDIKPNFRPILDKFATTLAQNTNTRVNIIGHTDNTGSDAVNDPLSMNRAAHARDYIAARGVNANRIQIAGRGSHEPLFANDSEANRARNRRVEIFVAEPQQASGNPPPAPMPAQR